jgi:hypothetical protein
MRICVIGSGLAGLVEVRDRLGGRVWSRRLVWIERCNESIQYDRTAIRGLAV